jgi:ribosomal protein L20
MNIFVKKPVFGKKKKKLRTVRRTVKKSEIYLPVTQKRVEISQKFKQIWIQQTKSNSSA